MKCLPLALAFFAITALVSSKVANNPYMPAIGSPAGQHDWIAEGAYPSDLRQKFQAAADGAPGTFHRNGLWWARDVPNGNAYVVAAPPGAIHTTYTTTMMTGIPPVPVTVTVSQTSVVQDFTTHQVTNFNTTTHTSNVTRESVVNESITNVTHETIFQQASPVTHVQHQVTTLVNAPPKDPKLKEVLDFMRDYQTRKPEKTLATVTVTNSSRETKMHVISLTSTITNKHPARKIAVETRTQTMVRFTMVDEFPELQSSMSTVAAASSTPSVASL